MGYQATKEAANAIDVTPEMISAGVGVLIDYEIGGLTARETARLIFVSMLSASSLGSLFDQLSPEPESTVLEHHRPSSSDLPPKSSRSLD
jgi:hypothetical protein